MKRPVKCRVCIDGDCHLCTRYVGTVEVSGEHVEDCCCLHQFDPELSDSERSRPVVTPPTPGSSTEEADRG